MLRAALDGGVARGIHATDRCEEQTGTCGAGVAWRDEFFWGKGVHSCHLELSLN